MNKFYNKLYINKIKQIYINLFESILNSNHTHLKSEFLYLLKRIILKYYYINCFVKISLLKDWILNQSFNSMYTHNIVWYLKKIIQFNEYIFFYQQDNITKKCKYALDFFSEIRL